MSAHRLTENEHREASRGREDVLRLVRQRLSQNARVVRLSGRIRRAVGLPEPAVSQTSTPSESRD